MTKLRSLVNEGADALTAMEDSGCIAGRETGQVCSRIPLMGKKLCAEHDAGAQEYEDALSKLLSKLG